MIKTCPICGEEFESKGKRVYCSEQCHLHGASKQHAEWYKRKTAREKWSWSLEQAGRLYNICYDKQPNDVLERLAKYVYNNYKRK